MARATRLLILLFSLSFATLGAVANPPVLEGPTFLPGDAASDEATGNQEEVAIAAGGGGFLVAWTDMRTSLPEFGWHDAGSGRDVYAARLDAGGNVIDTVPMILTQAAGSQSEPEIAWNGQNWLVIWKNQTMAEDGVGSPIKIYGARVAPDGTVLDSPFEIFEAPGYAGDMISMAVAANGTQWLVVGQADSGGPLGGVRVAADGTVVDTVPATLVPDTITLYFNASLHVAQGEYLLVYAGDFTYEARRLAPDLSLIAGPIYLPEDLPRIGSNGTDYFMAWDPPGPTLLGSRMSLDGTLLDPAGIPLMESLWDPILHTRVEWDGTNWWVLHWLPYPDGGLHLARVSPAGVVIDSPPFHAFDPADEEFVGPFALEGNPTGGVQLVWADHDCGCRDDSNVSLHSWDIHGANVSAAGQIGSETPVSLGAPAQTQPELTAGPDQFLAVFRSESADVKHIVAQRLDNLGNPIDAEPIEIAAGTYVTHPAAAWNGSLYMIVWDEFYYCIGGDPPPCGNFIRAVRMLPDGTVLDAQPITVMEANQADVAALGANFLVVGRDNAGFHEHEIVPLGMRVDGPTGALLDPEPLLLGWSFAVQPRVTTFGDRWLVVFERKATHDSPFGSSYLNFVAADGTVRFGAFETPVACGGGGPDVSASGAAALVVCREGRPGHFLNSINGGLVLPDGTLGASFEISDAEGEQREPAVTWNGKEFLVAWGDQRNWIDYFDERTDIYGARVDTSGLVLDPDGFPIATASVPEQQVELAWSGADVMLAASIFRDAPHTNYRIAAYHTSGTPNDDPPVALFSGAPTAGCAPLAVDYTDQSVGDVSSWYWGFGDGSFSVEQNPTHVYQNAGTYTVFLTADSGRGADSHVEFDYVTVDEATAADFLVDRTTGCGSVTVSFTDRSAGGPTSWLWNFGDGTQSTEQHPTHTYQFPGTYNVSLTVDGPCGPNTLTAADLIDIPGYCPIQHVAVEEMSINSNPVGTYLDTHPDSNSAQSLFEVNGTLDHRWRIDVETSTEALEFYVMMYRPSTANDVYYWEHSTDNVSFTRMTTVEFSGWTHTRVPVPATLQGSVWVRVIDSSSTPTYSAISVGALAFERAVSIPATCGNGTIDPGEQCDDGNVVGADGCSVTCQVEPGFECPTPGEACLALCFDQTLVTGWNMVGCAVDLAYDAAALCQEITADGGDPVEIDWFVNGGWESHVCGLPFNNFAIEPGKGYFVRTNGPSTWCQSAPSIASPFEVSFIVGWNGFSLPAWADGWTAEGLCLEIDALGGDAIEIDRYVNGGWESHICGLPFNDFPIAPATGYFALVGSASALQLTTGDAPAKLGGRAARGLAILRTRPCGESSRGTMTDRSCHRVAGRNTGTYGKAGC